MKKEKYNVKKLPFPIRPGDQVYFVLDDNKTIEEKTAEVVGINDYNNLVIRDDEWNYKKIGKEDRVFMTVRDAERYIEDPESIQDNYGEMESVRKKIPYHPGDYFYYCDFDVPMRRWDIIGIEATLVLFNAAGDVSIGDGSQECIIMGKNPDPCFDSVGKARGYIRRMS